MAETMKVGERGSEQVIEKWLGERRKVSRVEIQHLLELAEAHDGELVGISAFGAGTDPDDWCGTMWFRKPKPKIGSIIEALLEKGWIVEVFPRGIPVINAIELQIKNQAHY